MSRVYALELLTAGGTNRHEFLGSNELLLMGLQLGACRDVTRLCVSQLRAEDLGEHLTLSNALTEVGHHASNPPADDRCHHDLFVGVGLDHTRRSNASGRRSRQDRSRGNTGALNRLLAQSHNDVWQRLQCSRIGCTLLRRRTRCGHARSRHRRLFVRGRTVRHPRSHPDIGCAGTHGQEYHRGHHENGPPHTHA